LYKLGQYDKVIRNSEEATRLYKGQPILSRFLYLQALSIGKTKSLNEFEMALKKITSVYPGTEVAAAAQNTLDFLSRQKEGNAINSNNISTTVNNNSNKEQVNTNIPASSLNYKFDPSAFHFFVVIVNAKSNDISQLRNLISDHNKLYFSLEKLNTTNIFFTTNEQMITVSNFKDKEKAMTYYYSIEKNNNLRTMLDKLNANKFIISAENYSTLYKQKNVEDYKQFFIKNYLNL